MYLTSECTNTPCSYFCRSNPGKTRWDSTAGLHQEFEAHFETRSHWKTRSGKEWWVDGSGDFSGVSELYQQEKPLTAGDDSISLVSSSGAKALLAASTVSYADGTQRAGSWVSVPFSVWISDNVSDDEKEALLPLEALQKQVCCDNLIHF